jgi:uncharacterized membrane protein
MTSKSKIVVSKTKKQNKKNKKKAPIRSPKKTRSPKSSFSIPKFKHFRELAIGLTLVAIAIRVFNLGELTLWVDEYVHVLGVKAFLDGKGPLMPYDGNGFLYNFLILPFFALFQENEFWARLPSAISGGFSVYLVYILCKEILNEKIGIYAACLTAFSLYMIFWSRVSRNYALFSCTYLFLLWTFVKVFKPEEKALELKNNIFSKLELNPKYLGLSVIALGLAFFSHKLVLFFFFSAVFYFIFMAFEKGIAQPNKAFNNIFFFFAIPSFLFLLFFFTPTLSVYVKKVMGGFMHEAYLNWVMADWEEVGRLWKDEKYKVFDIYKNIILYSYNPLYYLGLAGFITTFIFNRKAAWFLISFFIVPLLLMSFILRGIYNPRYLVFLYPIFLMSMASAAYFIFNWLPEKFATKQYHSTLYNVCLLLPLILFFSCTRVQEISDLITLKHKAGFVVDSKLSTWSFTNWKEPNEYLKKHMKDGDVVLSTLPQATNHYMGWEEAGSIQFRQKFLNTDTGQYEYYQSDNPTNMDGNTMAGLQRTISEHPRGWLLADYYFNTVYTAQEARNLVFGNMDLHFDATSSGDVAVYSWDHSTPKVFPQQDIVFMVATNRNNMASKKLNFNVNEQLLSRPETIIDVAIQANNSNREAFMVINEAIKYFIPANNTNGVERFQIKVKSNTLKPQGNSIQFGYEGDRNRDPRKGYAIHSIQIR